MDDWLILGLVAGFLTTVGFVPQIIKSIHTRKMEGVSLLMPMLLSLGMFLWLLYGIVKGDTPIIIWNAIALGLNLILISMKYHFTGM
jgi:MtN3 and saliva related transmembrane protein